MMQYSVIIPAAGKGTRMGLGYNKAYYRMQDGRTILEHTAEIFASDSDCREIVIVTDPEEYETEIGAIEGKIKVTSGGSSRQESVYSGLKEVTSDYVMIHDGARPYLSQECLHALKQAMEVEDAACLTVPCKDTIKVVNGGYIVKTIERAAIAAAQTPQAFRTELIRYCMKQAIEEGYTGTDDCSLVERYSDVRIKVVEGSYANLKITTPEDL